MSDNIDYSRILTGQHVDIPRRACHRLGGGRSSPRNLINDRPPTMLIGGLRAGGRLGTAYEDHIHRNDNGRPLIASISFRVRVNCSNGSVVLETCCPTLPNSYPRRRASGKPQVRSAARRLRRRPKAESGTVGQSVIPIDETIGLSSSLCIPPIRNLVKSALYLLHCPAFPPACSSVGITALCPS